MSDTARLKSTLYVSNLAMEVTPPILESAFVPFGDIVSVSLPKPELASNTGPHRGFGYVEFEDAGDAKEAIDNMDQSELYGRVIKVAQAKPQKNAEEGLGSKTAVWEQVRLRLLQLLRATLLSNKADVSSGRLAREARSGRGGWRSNEW